MKRVASETNSAHFMELWNLPESAILRSQTLDKLALALVATNPLPILTNYQAAVSSYATAALLRPLLGDLIEEEWYLEATQKTERGQQKPDAEHGSDELVLAIKLETERSALWKTNLANLTRAGSTANPVVMASRHGFTCPASSFACSNGWTIVGFTGAEPNKSLSAEFGARICKAGSPVGFLKSGGWLKADGPTRQVLNVTAPEPWLQAEVDLAVLSHGQVATDSASNWQHGTPPTVSLSVIGDGNNVLTRGRLDFSSPLSLQIPPWQIPTNVIGDPLSSFTALRGLGPWLSSLGPWKALQAGPIPNQLFFWARPGTLAFLTYFAAPMPDASNWVDRASGRLLTDGNAWVTNNSLGEIIQNSNDHGVTWKTIPFMVPFLKTTNFGGTEFVFGGLFNHLPGTRPLPELLLRQLEPTNLVYYDQEMTGARIEPWIHIGQLSRLLLLRSHLPPESASMAWLNSLKPKLENTITVVHQTGPAQLTFTRVSGSGFTAVELHALADWFESPTFPYGFNTVDGPTRKPINRGLPARHP